MGWLNIFRSNSKSSASVAKERLQVIVAHQRGSRAGADLEYLPSLQRDLLEVIRRYVKVNDDAVKLEVERDGDMEVLELNITLPERGRAQHAS